MRGSDAFINLCIYGTLFPLSVIHVSVINVHVFSDFSNTCVYHNWQILHVHNNSFNDFCTTAGQ